MKNDTEVDGWVDVQSDGGTDGQEDLTTVLLHHSPFTEMCRSTHIVFTRIPCLLAHLAGTSWGQVSGRRDTSACGLAAPEDKPPTLG